MDVVEFCLCHREIWEDQIALLKHQVNHYQREAGKKQVEADLFQAAVQKMGRNPEELKQENEANYKEERRLERMKEELRQEPCRIESYIQHESNRLREWMLAMAAWRPS